jgi:outer membrane protein assembly factor BamB
MKTILFLVSIFISIGCSKQHIEPNNPCAPSPCDTAKLLGKLDTIWTQFILDNKSIIGDQSIHSFGDYIILGYSKFPQSFISAFHKDSIETRFQYINESIQSIGKLTIDSTNQFTILQRDGLTIRLDLPNLQVSQQHQFTQGWSANTFGQLIGNQYYTTRRNYDDTECYLIRASVDDLTRWDTVYTLVQGPQTGDSRPNVQSYNLWIHPQTGDSILIMQHRMAFPTRADVLAFNLSKREVVWKHENLTPDGNSNHQPIFIHDNKAYYGGSKVFYCFDLLNGKVLWTFDEPRGFTSFTIHQPAYCPKTNAIIVRSGGYLNSFIPHTGSLNWRIFIDGDGSSGSPNVHEGIIYLTSNHKLMALRSTDGKILWNEFENGPKWGTPTFEKDIVIDPDRNCLYATDRLRLYAIKLYGEE